MTITTTQYCRLSGGAAVAQWSRGTLNSRRATCPLVRLVEEKEKWEVSDLFLNWGGTEPNRIVSWMMLRVTVNDRRISNPLSRSISWDLI
ncbi:hypothetical protein TNCV_5094881 [Trichonephila clavipes]|nr:hypothetical protein TNCV_5094881 [Trichonephila clavipes]